MASPVRLTIESPVALTTWRGTWRCAGYRGPNDSPNLLRASEEDTASLPSAMNVSRSQVTYLCIQSASAICSLWSRDTPVSPDTSPVTKRCSRHWAVMVVRAPDATGSKTCSAFLWSPWQTWRMSEPFLPAHQAMPLHCNGGVWTPYCETDRREHCPV